MNYEIHISDLRYLEEIEQRTIALRRAIHGGKAFDFANYHPYEEVYLSLLLGFVLPHQKRFMAYYQNGRFWRTCQNLPVQVLWLRLLWQGLLMKAEKSFKFHSVLIQVQGNRSSSLTVTFMHVSGSLQLPAFGL